MSKYKPEPLTPLKPEVVEEIKAISNKFLSDFTANEKKTSNKPRLQEEWVGKLPEIDLHNPEK